jgi:hypothetical protein
VPSNLNGKKVRVTVELNLGSIETVCSPVEVQL